MKRISLDGLYGFLEKISETQTVIAPIEEAGVVNFGVWDKDKEVRLDVLKTVKSPKGAFFPQVEGLMQFVRKDKNIEITPEKVLEEDFVIFGVRPCDAKSFEILDRVFLADPADPYYKARREHGTVISLACSKPEESCFCSNFDIDAAEPSGDVAAWIADGYLYLEAKTEKGEKLISALEDTDGKDVQKAKEDIRGIISKLPYGKLNLEGFDGEHLMEKFESEQWKKLSEGCLGCGTCTFVCPTCQCYDVRDFDTGDGIQRYRCWDSCMFSDFTLMAHGTNRPTQLERFRQRFMHKLVYFPSRNEGIYSCVGCGRCVDKCPQSINIIKVIKALGVKE